MLFLSLLIILLVPHRRKIINIILLILFSSWHYRFWCRSPRAGALYSCLFCLSPTVLFARLATFLLCPLASSAASSRPLCKGFKGQWQKLSILSCLLYALFFPVDFFFLQHFTPRNNHFPAANSSFALSFSWVFYFISSSYPDQRTPSQK